MAADMPPYVFQNQSAISELVFHLTGPLQRSQDKTRNQYLIVSQNVLDRKMLFCLNGCHYEGIHKLAGYCALPDWKRNLSEVVNLFRFLGSIVDGLTASSL